MGDPKASVFISYNWGDKPLARALAAGLEGCGYRVWIDEGELRAGDSIVQRVSEAIAQVDFLVAASLQDPEQIADDLLAVVPGQFARGELPLAQQEPAVGAVAAQVEVFPGAALAPGSSESHARLRSLLAFRQRPWFPQVLVAELLQLLEANVGEAVHIDGHGTAHLMQQQPHEFLAMTGYVIAEREMALLPQRLVGRDVGQIQVVDPQQPGLFQVGHGDPPATLQIQVEAVADDGPQGLPRLALHAEPGFRVLREVGERDAQRVRHALLDHLVAQPLGLGLDGAVQRSTELGDLDEIVEVPRLRLASWRLSANASSLRASAFRSGCSRRLRTTLALTTDVAELRPSTASEASLAKSLPRCS